LVLWLLSPVRRIWFRRNKFVFDKIFTHPPVVFKEAVDSLEDFRRYNRRDKETMNSNGVLRTTRPPTGWQPPPSRLIKVNWNASVNIKKKYIGIGIVARDNNDNFLGARAVTKMVVAKPKVAEAMAAPEAILFSKESGFFEVILEGEAMQVVNEVNSAAPTLSSAGRPVC
jgi:hypothetical protein